MSSLNSHMTQIPSYRTNLIMLGLSHTMRGETEALGDKSAPVPQSKWLELGTLK
jgi:hypothetical protein